MKYMGVLDWDIRTWDAKPEVDKTFDNIKTLFKDSWRNYRNNQKTTKAVGYHSANTAIYEDTVDSITVFTTHTQRESKATEARNKNIEDHMAVMVDSIKEMKKNCFRSGGGSGAKVTPTDRGLAVKVTECRYNPRYDDITYYWVHGWSVGNNHTSACHAHSAQ